MIFTRSLRSTDGIEKGRWVDAVIIAGFCGLIGILLAADEKWGAAAFSWVVGLFILACWISEKKDVKAWYNRREYWSKSGKDRAKLRHQWECEARAEEEKKRLAALERERRKRDKQMNRTSAHEKQETLARKVMIQGDPNRTSVGSDTEMGRLFQTNNRSAYVNSSPTWEFTCRSCRRKVRMTILNPMKCVDVSCPFCGNENAVKFME